jgi:hypothetical protein
MRGMKTYTFRNEDSSSRDVVVEHPARQGYELRSATKPAETIPAWLRFRVRVEPMQTASLVVEEARPLQTTWSLSSLQSDQVAVFVHQQSIDKTIEAALHKILAQKAVIRDLETRKTNLEHEASTIFDWKR